MHGTNPLKSRCGLLLAGVLALTLVSSCTHPRDASRRILEQIDAALDSATPLATQFAAPELSIAQGKADTLHNAFDARLYARILEEGPAVIAELQQIAALAINSRDSLQQAEWNGLIAAVPALQQRVREWLAQQPARSQVDRRDLNQVSQDLARAASMWEAAQRDYATDDIQADLSGARTSASLTLILVHQTFANEMRKQ